MHLTVTHCLSLFLFHILQISQTVWSPHTVERSLQDSCLGFLRSACTMASLCYDVEVPRFEVSATFYAP